MAAPSGRSRGPFTPESLLEVVLLSSASKPRRDEPAAKFLARQTHLHLHGRRLRSAALPAGTCNGLRTLYLYDNEIEALEGIGSLPQLTHLYAQNNHISHIGGDIGGLKSLRKLYLNGNCLTSLAPLAPLAGLEELHASSQRLPPGTMLDVAPNALAQMPALRVLALANNQLQTTEALAVCRALETVDLSKNELRGIKSVSALITASPLVDIDLRENEVSDSRQDCDAIIVACPTLVRLNSRELSQSERPFLQQLHMRGKRPHTFANDEVGPGPAQGPAAAPSM